MAKTKYGKMKCPTPGCGELVIVKVNERETLSWNCQECDHSGYVRKGDAGYAKWAGSVTRQAEPAPAATPKKEEVKKDTSKSPAAAPAKSSLLV